MKNLGSSESTNIFFASKENFSECISLLICKLMDLISYIKCKKIYLQNNLLIYDLSLYDTNELILIQSEIEPIYELRNNISKFIAEYENNKSHFSDALVSFLDSSSWENLTTRFIFVKLVRKLITTGFIEIKNSIVTLTKEKTSNYKALFDKSALNQLHLNRFLVYDASISYMFQEFYFLEIDKVFNWVFFNFEYSCDFYAIWEIRNKIVIQKSVYTDVSPYNLKLTSNVDNIKKLQLISNFLCSSYVPSIRCLILQGIIYTTKYGEEDPLDMIKDDLFSFYKGKWLDFDLEKNRTLNFALFISNLNVNYFENFEYDIIKAVRVIGMLIMKKKEVLTVEFSNYNDWFDDFKEMCELCKEWRSKSLFCGKKCIICYKDTKERYICENSKKSYFKKCSECLLIYVVITKPNKDFINGSCYYCNKIFDFEIYKCLKCRYFFMYLLNDKCAICHFNNCKVEYITIQDFIIANGAEYIGMKITDTLSFFSLDYKLEKENKDNILKMYGTYPFKSQIENNEVNFHDTCVNIVNIRFQTIDFLNYNKKKECQNCFIKYFDYEIYSICGSFSCTFCVNCISKQFLEPYRGKLFKTCHSKCILCNNFLFAEEDGVFNYFFRYCLLKTENTLKKNVNIYGICLVCKNVDVLIPNTIDIIDYETIINYTCKFCSETILLQCPKCRIWNKIPIYKDYIICMNIICDVFGFNIKCGAVWCLNCNINGISFSQDLYDFKTDKKKKCDHNTSHSYKKDYDIKIYGDDSFDWSIEKNHFL